MKHFDSIDWLNDLSNSNLRGRHHSSRSNQFNSNSSLRRETKRVGIENSYQEMDLNLSN